MNGPRRPEPCGEYIDLIADLQHQIREAVHERETLLFVNALMRQRIRRLQR